MIGGPIFMVVFHQRKIIGGDELLVGGWINPLDNILVGGLEPWN